MSTTTNDLKPATGQPGGSQCNAIPVRGMDSSPETNGPPMEKVGVVGCHFINPVPIAREQVLLRVARGLQSAGKTMEPILDVEQKLVFHMLKAAQCVQTLIYEAHEDLELSDLIAQRDWLLYCCEQIMPPKPDWPGNVIPIAEHPRYRFAG